MERDAGEAMQRRATEACCPVDKWTDNGAHALFLMQKVEATAAGGGARPGLQPRVMELIESVQHVVTQLCVVCVLAVDFLG